MPAVELPRGAQKYTEVKEMETIEYIQTRAQGIAKYSDKLRQSIKDIDVELTPYFEEAGIIVFDDEFEYTNRHGTKFQLVVNKSHKGEWGIYLDNGYQEDLLYIGDASRTALKQATPRIIPMLEKYAKILEQTETEYMGIAAKAESMSKSIKGL